MAFFDHGLDGPKMGELSEAGDAVHRALKPESRDLDCSLDFVTNLSCYPDEFLLQLWFLT